MGTIHINNQYSMKINLHPFKKHMVTVSAFAFVAAAVISPLAVSANENETIATNATNTPELSTLVTALDTAGLVPTFADESAAFTVFAPTNDAFAAAATELGISATELLALPNLGEILQYHVVAAEAFSTDLSDGQELETLTGGMLTVDIQGSDVFIVDEQNRRAQVTTADVDSSNGVVHIVDRVVLEAADEAATSTLSDTGLNLVVFYTTVAGALAAATFAISRKTLRKQEN